MKILECKKLSIGYNEKVVCKDITFSIESGEFVCIVGENGSGKSTLLKTILGLNKILGGKLIFDKDFNRNKVGYLPQQCDTQKDFPAIVKEVVMSGFLNGMGWRFFYNNEEKEKAEEIMKYLGIEGFMNLSFKELSGGQQQKVLLARALCATDNLLILDEPTNALDVRTRNKFYDLIADLNKKGMTIIMVSHNLDKVIDKATHIIYLKDTAKFIGKKEDFLQTEYASFHNLKGVN